MLTANEVTEIFYLSDEFSKEFAITFILINCHTIGKVSEIQNKA